MFLKAIRSCPDVIPKATLNLALVHKSRAGSYADRGDIPSAIRQIERSSRYLDEDVYPNLENWIRSGNEELSGFARGFKSLRLNVHKTAGQYYAAVRRFEDTEREFRRMTESYPDEGGAWEILARVLALMGRGEEAGRARDRIGARGGGGGRP